jgi:hypothetical protein
VLHTPDVEAASLLVEPAEGRGRLAKRSTEVVGAEKSRAQDFYTSTRTSRAAKLP